MKKILITGANGCLGSRIAKKLIKQKVPLILHCQGDRKPIDSLLALAKRNSVSVETFCLDFEEKDLQLKKFLPKPNDIGGLIMCHAYYKAVKIDELTIEELDRAYRVNYSAPLEILQYLTKTWGKSSHEESVIFIGSVATRTNSPHEIPYHSTKMAFQTAIKSYVREYSNHKNKIRFNIISPGIMDTPMGIKALETRSDILDRVPMRRFTQVDEVAEMAINLTFKYISIVGQNIHMNNGRWTD